jgi:hypothetical protein
VTDDSDEQIWAAFLSELAWLRGQMNPQLRERLAPLFVLFELKTVVLCVRGSLAARSGEVERLLAHSQLGDGPRAALRQWSDAGPAIGAFAAAWTGSPLEAAALERAYASDGLKAFEQQLTRGLLETLAAARLHPDLRRFFRAFVDVRNLVTLYKHLRWGGGSAADFVTGGEIDRARLAEVSAGKDSAALDVLVQRVAGRRAPPLSLEEPALESILLGVLSALVRSLARDGEPTAVALEYAWQCYVHARNSALVRHAGLADPGTLARELIA